MPGDLKKKKFLAHCTQIKRTFTAASWHCNSIWDNRAN